MRTVTRGLAVLFVAMVSTLAGACELVALQGDFHQVTAIRGRVVGKSLGPFQFRWLRQSFGVSAATLTLYEYRWPAQINDLKVIATIKVDSRGHFDLGPVGNGHYVLAIDVPDADLMSTSFDVEVTDAVRATDSITIDVSPIKPDCSGGHELIEYKKS